MRELPPSPPQQQRELEDLPEEEHSSTQEVTAERPIRMEGMLEIKLKQGGIKGLDHWEEVLAVLEGETLSLFQDRAAAAERASRWPPINMEGVSCRVNAHYRRKENTFKLILEDGTQFLFAAQSRELQLLWVKKLQNCPESASSDSEDSGASSVNLSLEKLAEAQEDSSSTKQPDRRAESLERQLSTEGQPPPKPPHSYYNKHNFFEEGEASTDNESHQNLPPPEDQDSPTETSQLPEDNASRDRSKKSVFRKFFTKK
ncbi:spectrin beta chain, non-erythrocytic 1-like [Eleginops maclovinus]|uniref:spectrin beta chain, non-erythrocytic 1-like n=1 Tax=Eleginops maclovinus TaxID=56733 RepID=UPI0030805D88